MSKGNSPKWSDQYQVVGLHHSLYQIRTLYCWLHVPCRYADVIWVTEARGPETCSFGTGASSSPSHRAHSLLSCHFSPNPLHLLSLWNKSSFCMGELRKKPRAVPLYLPVHLFNAQLLIKSFRELCHICRFMEPALHHTEMPAPQHVHMCLVFIVTKRQQDPIQNGIHLVVHIEK